MNYIFKVEDGNSIPVRFLDPEDVKMYDSEQNEIVVPKCPKCSTYKDLLIGKESGIWICNACDAS